MKKIIIILLTFILCMGCFVGCQTTDSCNNPSEDPINTERPDPDISDPEGPGKDDHNADESAPDPYEKFVPLTELIPIEQEDGYCRYRYDECCISGRLLCNGFPVSDGISMHPGETEDASLTFDVSGFDYSTFAVTVGKNDQQKDCSGQA